jgi:hypothetical protein
VHHWYDDARPVLFFRIARFEYVLDLQTRLISAVKVNRHLPYPPEFDARELYHQDAPVKYDLAGVVVHNGGHIGPVLRESARTARGVGYSVTTRETRP